MWVESVIKHFQRGIFGFGRSIQSMANGLISTAHWKNGSNGPSHGCHFGIAIAKLMRQRKRNGKPDGMKH